MVKLSKSFKKILELQLPLHTECFTSVENCWWIINDKLIPTILEEFNIPIQENIYDYRRYLFDNKLLGIDIGIPENNIDDIKIYRYNDFYSINLDKAPQLHSFPDIMGHHNS
jgi:hypothetical protein